jgi:hypothetical protein
VSEQKLVRGGIVKESERERKRSSLFIGVSAEHKKSFLLHLPLRFVCAG